MYRRYRIVDEGDIERALEKTQEPIKQAPPTTVADMGLPRGRHLR